LAPTEIPGTTRVVIWFREGEKGRRFNPRMGRRKGVALNGEKITTGKKKGEEGKGKSNRRVH